jgi:hypothetical protein
MPLKDIFVAIPTIDQVLVSQFYIPGYTESLRIFSEVRVVPSGDWLEGVSEIFKSYFIKVGFPCYLVPIFQGGACYGFVVKSFGKFTPRFCTNDLLPGCERLRGGEVVIFVEGFKDCFCPMLACKGLSAVVLPMLTALPGRALLGRLKSLGCRVVFVPDNDENFLDHVARFSELCGREQIGGSVFCLEGIKDFGDFFGSLDGRAAALREAKRLRRFICQSV